MDEKHLNEVKYLYNVIYDIYTDMPLESECTQDENVVYDDIVNLKMSIEELFEEKGVKEYIRR